MRRRLLLGILAAALLVLAAPAAAFAQEPLVVTTTEDESDGECDATCSLRDAVSAANADREPPMPTIVLKAATYVLTEGELVLSGEFTIAGSGSRATTIEVGEQGRVAYVAAESDITVKDLTVTGGVAFGEGENGFGGGFRVAVGGKLLLSRATVAGNSASAAGGGISNAGTLVVERSTVSFNSAGGFGPAGDGGGIHVEADGHAELRNSTLSSNEAIGIEGDPSEGGAIHTAGSFSMEHVTIAWNDSVEGAGLYQASQAESGMSMWNTLFAANRGQACAGTLSSIEESHNLSNDATCELDQAGDLENGSPRILELADDGGPTDTHALGTESDAIDAANPDRCPDVDQRDFRRPAADACDIGAVERRLDPVVDTTADGKDGACTSEPNDCTLRDALRNSERDAEITLDEGEYEVALGELQLRGLRTIFGQGARRTTLRATGTHRVIAVPDGDTALFGVTITGGRVEDAGGGILVQQDAALTIFESAVAGNSAAAGGGIANEGLLILLSSTIAANDASGEQGGMGVGGGLLTAGSQAWSSLTNSTVSSNTASTAGGGIANLGGTLNTFNVTIAGNRLPTAKGGGVYGATVVEDGVTWMSNTLVATNAGAACAWTPEHEVLPDNSLADDGSCFDAGDGNRVDVDPRIGDLSSKFGPTDVHPLLPGSPAFDTGDDDLCPDLDQRGAQRIPRQGLHCDIGAFEIDAISMLHVVMQVINDSGGAKGAGDFTVRVRSGGRDVLGRPRTGSSGMEYTLAAGMYSVAADAVSGYTLSVGGNCASDGTVILAHAESKECVVTANDVAVQSSGPPPQQVQQQPSPPPSQIPPPEPGESVNVVPKSGTVKIKVKGTNKFVELKEGQQIPVGSVIDTTKGRVTLVAASNKSGGTATADFYAGIFKVGQTKGTKPTTTLELVQKLACGRGQASAAAKRKKSRRLWGDGSGRFRTEGSYSSATVRGTKWLVEDQCKSTLTKVTRGKVAVRDFVKRKTVIVRAGKQYVARARR
jgi:CSLREA domain-containing protein